jgi:ABC-type multidrug transport system fused ATPase/permease subunit
MKNGQRPGRAGFEILVELVRRYPGLLGIIFALGFLASLAAAPTPYLGKVIIDDLIFRGGTGAAGNVSGWLGVSHTVWMIGGIVLLGIFLKLMGSLLGAWQCHYILQITRNALYEVRLDTALRLMGGRQEEIEKVEPGRIASRLGFDVSQMDGAIFSILRNFVTSFFTVFVVIGFMLFLNLWLTIIVLATMPLTAALTLWSYRKLRAFNREESDRLADLNATSAETFGALRIIRTFTAEPFFLERIRQKSESLRYEGLHHWTRFHAINLLLLLLSNLGSDIFLFVGGVLALNGQITFGAFFAFYGYQAMLWGPIGTLLNAGQILQNGTASAEKVETLAQTPIETYLEEPRPPQTGAFQGEVVADNLTFAYPGNDPVIREVSFRIEPGWMVALVGQSGSGKTTLASLLLGMYEPTEGKLLVDGKDIRQWDLRQLRSHVGAVLQDPTLFNDTIRTNVCLGKEYSEARVWSALAAAHIDDFVRKLPRQLDEPCGIGGARLSGGQKQRIAIARVFLKNPKLLILDEATSALDSETEKAIQRSFDALMTGRTSVVIAHRLSTIFQADQILVLHQGRLVEAGTHEQLVARSGGHYRELYEAQVEGMIPMSGATRKPWSTQPR